MSVDLHTLEAWLDKLGYDAAKSTTESGGPALRIKPRGPDNAGLPPFFVQLSENWVLLSILPVFADDAPLPTDLRRRLLSVNSEMRIAKFALGKNSEVVLCAELPTESLDYPEFADAAERMVRYVAHYREYLEKPRITSA